jgi:hypothetical protein
MSDSESDWDADFDEPTKLTIPTSKPTVVLSGLAPNPDNVEDWGDDFDDPEPASPSPKAGALFFRCSSPCFLATFPFLAVFDRDISFESLIFIPIFAQVSNDAPTISAWASKTLFSLIPFFPPSLLVSVPDSPLSCYIASC